MYINVLEFIENEDPSRYSASQSELGRDAVEITWDNALDAAENVYDTLLTADDLPAVREHFAGFGAWSRLELDKMDKTELTALILQMTAAEMRNGNLDEENHHIYLGI